MFCPKCSSAIVDEQRFCRNCGLKLDLIVDAIEGKSRNPLDFDTLKRDLRDLGSSLRAGFEEAGIQIKRTKRLDKQPPLGAPPGQAMQPIQLPNWSREINKVFRKVKVAHSRKYSLQQAMISILGGGAMAAVMAHLLDVGFDSGLLGSLEQWILHNGKVDVPLAGLVPLMRELWVLWLIPVARGVAHLINGIFFAPKQIEEVKDPLPTQPAYVYSSPAYNIPPAPVSTPVPTNELEPEKQPNSVTEDATLRL